MIGKDGACTPEYIFFNKKNENGYSRLILLITLNRN